MLCTLKALHGRDLRAIANAEMWKARYDFMSQAMGVLPANQTVVKLRVYGQQLLEAGIPVHATTYFEKAFTLYNLPQAEVDRIISIQ
jgi:hypothetical protein